MKLLMIILIALLGVLTLVGCDSGEMNRAPSPHSRYMSIDYRIACINGVEYLVYLRGNQAGITAHISHNTLKPIRCEEYLGEEE